jgi:hypothetical protein
MTVPPHSIVRNALSKERLGAHKFDTPERKSFARLSTRFFADSKRTGWIVYLLGPRHD